MEYIAFDSHKRYTLASVEKLTGEHVDELRVNHERGSIKEFLRRWEPGSPVAVETVGNWYWIVDEIEEAGMLPPQTRYATERLLEQLDTVEGHIQLFETRMREVFEPSPELSLVMSLPAVGFILGTVILLEIGDVDRFPSAEHLASYCGTTPRVHASGGKIHYGQVRQDVNRYLKWAFVEAANIVCLNHRRYPQRHVHRLYERLLHRKGHQKAIGAVARHLAEATYWILKKGQSYREPLTRKKGFVHGRISAGLS